MPPSAALRLISNPPLPLPLYPVKNQTIFRAEKAEPQRPPAPSARQEPAGIHDVIELDLVRFSDEAYEGRSCRRAFSSSAMPLRAFAQFLGLLKQEKVQGKEKYLYPSAGGLNAVQTYLYIRKNRVEGLDEGMYYYHPSVTSSSLLLPARRLTRIWFTRQTVKCLNMLASSYFLSLSLRP